MKKHFVFISFFISLLFSFIVTNTIAQTDTDDDTDESYNMLMFGLSYTNNNTTNKNLLDFKMPSMIGDISFYAKNGIWSTISYTDYIDAQINTYETELSLGFQKYLLKDFDFDISYAYHDFKGDTIYSGIDYSHKLDLSTGLDLGNFSLYLDNSLRFGETTNYFLDLSFSYNLFFNRLLFRNDDFMISPAIMASFGTSDFIVIDIIPKQIRRRGEIITRNIRVQSTQTEFLYQNLNFYIPVIYTLKDISIMAAWMYNIPSAKLKDYAWTNQASFLISLTYTPNIF